MKKIMTNIKTLAALLMASATFAACSSDDNTIDQQPAQPAGQQVYTMTVNAQKGGDAATTRALALDNKTLNATWATSENVFVKKGGTWATGSLQPQADGTTATLKGTLSGVTIAKDDVLTLQFPRSGELDYTGQVGTLADIAAKYDYATATVTVASVSATGNINPTEATTTFQNQQAIVKFTLIDKADDTKSLDATQLTINDGTTDYTVNPTEATSEIYVAIPGISEKTVTLTATVGSETYTYEKANVTFTNGQYYEITVKMNTAAAAKPLAEVTSGDIGKIVGKDGNIYATKDDAEAVATGNAVAMIAYVGNASNCTHGLAIALADEESWTNDYDEAVTACSGKTAVTGGTWRLPSIKDWQYIIGCGASVSYSSNPYTMSYSELASKLSTAKGDELDYIYWSSTKSADPEEVAWSVDFNYGDTASFSYITQENIENWDFFKVRACLAF